MNIGIITIYDNENHGNRLQNYALQQILLQYSYCVTTVKNKPRERNYIKRVKRKVPLAESVIVNRLMGKQNKVHFLAFNNRCIHVGKTCYWHSLDFTKLKREDTSDIYCAGSDQVWNPNFGRTGMFNYLGFAERDRTFSYAASFGVDKIPQEHVESVRRGLKHIKFISVREDSGKRIVEELTGRTDVQVLVDPTMLLSTEEWDQIARKPKQPLPEKYILTYFLGAVSSERRAAIQERARQLGCEIVELMDQNSPFYAIGPDHFVYLIKRAALVCTDSFHGSVFSFLYQRPLVIFERAGNGEDMSSRLVTLSEKFSLQHCFAVGDVLPNIPDEADYSLGYRALEEERKRSKAFLDMVFDEAERAGLCK